MHAHMFRVGDGLSLDYESTISINHQWPLSGVKRETEHGIACQMPDGRWIIEDTTQ